MSWQQQQQSGATQGGTVRTGFGSSATSSSLPAQVTVMFDHDLPNGPYCDTNMMSMTCHITPGMIYTQLAELIRIEWIKSRGAMMQQQMQRGVQYTEEWQVNAIAYKGGDVDPNGQVVEGVHNVQLGIIQKTGTEYVGGTTCCIVQ